MLVAVDTCQGCEHIGCCVRDQWCVVVGEQHTIIFDEIEQMRHLFEVRGYVGIVAGEVSVIKLDINDVLDVAFGRV